MQLTPRHLVAFLLVVASQAAAVFLVKDIGAIVGIAVGAALVVAATGGDGNDDGGADGGRFTPYDGGRSGDQ